MPYKIAKTDGGYQVSSPNGIKAKHTSKANAEAQVRLLNAKEHGWKPPVKKASKPKRRKASARKSKPKKRR